MFEIIVTKPMPYWNTLIQDWDEYDCKPLTVISSKFKHFAVPNMKLVNALICVEYESYLDMLDRVLDPVVAFNLFPNLADMPLN